MSLIDDMMEAFVLVNKVKTSDGEGGFTTTWQEGASFNAVLSLDTTMQARIAEQEGVKSVYTITTNKSVTLEFHDVVKRERDGRYFRITTNPSDKKSPNVSSLDMAQATAEGWELTTV